jgi:hypothetical protein
MTRDEAREFAKVVQAYADGKDAQYQASKDGKWRDAPELPLPSCCLWRIKPEPREGFAAIFEDRCGHVSTSSIYPTPEFPKRLLEGFADAGRVAKFREVIE